MNTYDQGVDDALACIESGLKTKDTKQVLSKADEIIQQIQDLSTTSNEFQQLYSDMMEDLSLLEECRRKSNCKPALKKLLYIENKMKIIASYYSEAWKLRCFIAEEAADSLYQSNLLKDAHIAKLEEQFNVPDSQRMKINEWQCVLPKNSNGFQHYALNKLTGTDTWRKKIIEVPTKSSGLKNLTHNRALKIQDAAIESGELTKRLPLPRSSIAVANVRRK